MFAFTFLTFILTDRFCPVALVFLMTALGVLILMGISILIANQNALLSGYLQGEPLEEGLVLEGCPEKEAESLPKEEFFALTSFEWSFLLFLVLVTFGS